MHAAIHITPWAHDQRSRLMVYALLILLVLSSISADVLLTHAHNDGPVHTHASRVLILQDIDPHHDSHHGHHHPSIPAPSGEPREGPTGCGTEGESTVVVRSADKLIRQGRDTSNRVLELPPAVVLLQSATLEVITTATHFRTSSSSASPSHVHFLRSTVLLI